MKIIIFGIGRQGKRILDLLLGYKFGNIFIYDINKDIIKQILGKYGNNVFDIEVNPFDYNENKLIKFLKNFDIIIDALPSIFSYQLLKAASKTGKKIISVSYLEEDFTEFDEIAKKYKTTIIPDCGAAPGMSHLLAGYSVNKIKNGDKVIMKVGAIPDKPIAPFYHNITWSPFDLIQEYIRKAKIKRNGKLVSEDPLKNIFDETIFNMELESFYTDGVRSFFKSFPTIPNIEERTLRYKGHINFMKALKSLGFLSNENLFIEQKKINLDYILAKLFEDNFGKYPVNDIYIMEIIVKNKAEIHKHKYIIKYDDINKVSALVNSVAITAVNAALLLNKNIIKQNGVLPLEKIASEKIYNSFIKAHKKVGAVYEFIREN